MAEKFSNALSELPELRRKRFPMGLALTIIDWMICGQLGFILNLLQVPKADIVQRKRRARPLSGLWALLYLSALHSSS